MSNVNRQQSSYRRERLPPFPSDPALGLRSLLLAVRFDDPEPVLTSSSPRFFVGVFVALDFALFGFLESFLGVSGFLALSSFLMTAGFSSMISGFFGSFFLVSGFLASGFFTSDFFTSGFVTSGFFISGLEGS